MKYTPIIGLEIHIQLATQTKMFCRCSAGVFADPPNTHTCPVCLGLPGALPVLNTEAVKLALLAGEALGSAHPKITRFDRKNYFYPDLPKGYQISQFDLPLNSGGEVALKEGKVSITRAHLEEDTGKLLHQGDKTYIDYNRSGVPLLEIVSDPVITSAEAAKEYGQKIQQLMRYAGVSEADMEKGSLRIDANVSIKPESQSKLGPKVEVKNMNSFRAVEKALKFEIERQTKVLEEGGEVEQETRGWDEGKEITIGQRVKEESHDYRYFPEPDLPAIEITKDIIDEIKSKLPEMPAAKLERVTQAWNLRSQDAKVITSDLKLANFFEESLRDYEKISNEKVNDDIARKVANWLTGEFLFQFNSQGRSWDDLNITPAYLAELLILQDRGEISASNAKEVLKKMIQTGETPRKVVEYSGYKVQSDSQQLTEIARKISEDNKSAVEDWKNGKEQAFGFLLGQLMKETKGQADPGAARQALSQVLNSNK